MFGEERAVEFLTGCVIEKALSIDPAEAWAMRIARLVEVPAAASLGVVALLIGGSVVASLLAARREEGSPKKPGVPSSLVRLRRGR